MSYLVDIDIYSSNTLKVILSSSSEALEHFSLIDNSPGVYIIAGLNTLLTTNANRL